MSDEKIIEEQEISARDKLNNMLFGILKDGLESGIDHDTLRQIYYKFKDDPEIIDMLAKGQYEDIQPYMLGKIEELISKRKEDMDMQIKENERQLKESKELMEQIQKLSAPMDSMTLEDGTVKPLTGIDLLDLLEKGLHDPAPDAKDTLEEVLGAILEYGETHPDIREDSKLSKVLEAVNTLFNYLHGVAQAEEIDKFFKGQREFMAIPRPAGIEELLKINGGKLGGEIAPPRENENIRITFSGRLGYNEQKISDMVDLVFANNNVHGTRTNLNRDVRLSFREVMEHLGKKQTARNRTEFRKQLEEQILPTIAQTSLELKDKDGNWLQIYRGAAVGANVKKDIIYFELTPKYAEYLNTGNMSQYNYRTFKLGSSNNPLPYYLARKLQDHYFHDGNRSRKDKEGNPQPTNNIIRIKTLLNFCTDTIPSYEDVQRTDRGHWVKRIRQPLEAALNDMTSVGLFEWQYCKRGLAEATPQEISTNDFRKWSELYITLKLIPEEPDQSKRLEHKQERIEAAAAKKAIKDAETIVKADKIEKSKARKRKKAAEK